MMIELSLWESLLGMLALPPVFWIGLVPLLAALICLLRQNRGLPKARTLVCAPLLFYYLGVVFAHIVGIPTLHELRRMAGLGEGLFHPNISLLPFAGLGLEFALNILCFVLLGLLCPLAGRTDFRQTVLFGFGLSLAIELSQLFTLYRATDINDLIANTAGATLGYLCFRLAARAYPPLRGDASDDRAPLLPPLIAAAASVLIFFS